MKQHSTATEVVAYEARARTHTQICLINITIQLYIPNDKPTSLSPYHELSIASLGTLQIR